jgi:hypothetical protein
MNINDARLEAKKYMDILIGKLMQQEPEIKPRFKCSMCYDQGVLYYGDEERYDVEQCPDCQG